MGQWLYSEGSGQLRKRNLKLKGQGDLEEYDIQQTRREKLRAVVPDVTPP